MSSQAKKKPSPFPDAYAQLQAIPVRNQAVEMLPGGPQDVRIAAVPVKYPNWLAPMARWLGWAGRKRKYELEGLGLAVYERIDGRTTIENLVDWLMAEHRLSFFESRALILHYVHQLMTKALVVVAVRKEGRAEASPEPAREP